MSNLQLRVISAVVMVVAVLFLTWLGGTWFRIFTALLGVAIFYEWMSMAKALDRPAGPSVVLLVVALAIMVAGGPAWIVLLFLAVAPIVVLLSQGLAPAGPWPASGITYAGLAALSLAFLRGDDQAGLIALLFLFATVWVTDILAYFVGRAVGGPKLAPSTSPGKTWSGAIGGAVAGTIAGLIIAWIAGGALVPLGVIALILSVVAQFGDLFESWVKRRHGVKDSSNVIPGHGGVMDRVDGLVAAALALYAIGALAGDPNSPARTLFPG
ncbi:MAG TPA: phosphatidate cytidylyltransferase [Rhizobiaceae bacterium]|nr:phosphatidate cytidylyltransferase [Rhizobiaceae bacterium]